MIEGVTSSLDLPPACDVNLFSNSEETKKLEKLPADISEARAKAIKSEFVKKVLPEEIIKAYCNGR